MHLNGIAELRLDVVRRDVIGRDLFREVLPELEEDGIGRQYRIAMGAGSVSIACELEVSGPERPRRLGLGIRSHSHLGTLGALVLVEDRSAVALEEARRRRAEQLAAIGEVATGVAHEINNPLASIKGFAQLLSSDPGGAHQAQALEIISQECTRVAGIIDRLLEFAGQQRIREVEELNLNAVVDEVLDLRSYALETSGIHLERDLDAELSPVRGERGALQRAVLALVRHAEEDLANHREARLIVRTRESTEGVVLYLIDNGPGVPRDRLRSLLRAGGQEDAAGGIGLIGAMEVAREHGGQLWADSIEGNGTVFFLRLPWGEAEKKPEAAHPIRREGRRGPPGPRELEILVADDESALRLALSLFLGREGHKVVQAQDAYEAHKLASEREFDVVMVDARMPGDGVALVKRLEATEEYHGRTILMTGDLSHPFATEAMRSGHPHLAKPFDMAEALRLVEQIAH